MISVNEDGRLNTVRQKIIDKQEQSMSAKDKGLTILALALTIGFFGSSAVLMPSQQSATGMFSGELQIQKPVASQQVLRDKQIQNSGISFVLDQNIRNPNVVETELERINYEVKLDGETVKRGSRESTTVVPPGEDRMVAVLHRIDFAGLPDTAEIIRAFETGQRTVTVEGTMDYSIAGTTVSVPFRKTGEF